MTTVIIVIVLIVIVLLALRSSVGHFKGQGSCCGGSGDAPPRKKLEGPKIAEKIVHIEGMQCQNCKNSVERQINGIQGAVAKVDLSKKQAVVSLSRMVSDEELTDAVERAEFTVTGIELREV